MRFEGNGRIIKLIGDKVIITTSNSLLGRLESKNNNNNLEINISDITSIDCKNASLFSNGYIKLYVNGKASLATTVMFFPKGGVYQEAVSFVTKLEEMKNSLRSSNKTGTSPADELKKYKELLDMGAITPEEYEKKKKELLNM